MSPEEVERLRAEHDRWFSEATAALGEHITAHGEPWESWGVAGYRAGFIAGWIAAQEATTQGGHSEDAEKEKP